MKLQCSDMDDFGGNNMEAYEKPLSLWKLVEEMVAPGERPDIRDILGISLVEQSLELHEEVDSLLSIWQDYRAETDDTGPPSPIGGALPEPHGMRDNLRTHIRMLLECVRERAKDEGRELDLVLSRHNSDVLDYVCDDLPTNVSPGMGSQRPGSSWSSRDGRETPMRMTPSSDGDRMSASSTVSDQVESVKDQLNILRIDEVANQLRSTLEDEIARLLNDTVFLQQCLEDESDFRSQSRMSVASREPSLQELKEERSRLEKKVQAPAQPSSVGLMNSVRGRNRSLPSSPKRLPSPLGPPSGSAKLRPSPPSSASLAGRTAPLKASHKASHPAPLPENHPKPLRRRTSEGSLSKDSKSRTGVGEVSRTELTNKPRSPVSSLRGGQDSPTRLQPSPPSSARPPVGRTGSGRFRHRVLEAKQSR